MSLWRQRSSLAAERTSLRVGLAAELCFASADSSRRGMSWIFFRKSAARPEPRSALEPPGLAPFSRLFRSSASVDHQMTPALFVPLFRACALSRHSLADRLSGTPSAALRPKASRGLRTKHGLGLSVEKHAACPEGELQAGLSRHGRMRYVDEKQGENMKNSNVHPFWKWAWRALCTMLTLPIILFPLAMLAVIIAVVFIEPMLNPY